MILTRAKAAGRRLAFLVWTSLLWSMVLSWAHAQAPKLLEVQLHRQTRLGQTRPGESQLGQTLLGMPVHWGHRDAVLLEPNGRFHVFDVAHVRHHQLLNEPFIPQPLTTARAELQAELGPAFETLVTGPYVLATPAGSSLRWQRRFVALLSGYTRYFELRGWPLRSPDFPLVVIVFPTRDEFMRYCRKQAGQPPSQAVGSYFPKSNRCVLFQISGARGTDWSETEATIVHEAVHQLAYNTGVHERLFENPTWFVEGLATMFEQSAVYDLGVQRSTISGRMNRSQLRTLQPMLEQPERLEANVRSLIRDDQLFATDPRAAYAVSWAMTFYLAERMPSEYRRFIQLQAQRRFGSYRGAARARDFRAAFGSDPSLLVHQISRLLQQ